MLLFLGLFRVNNFKLIIMKRLNRLVLKINFIKVYIWGYRDIVHT